ncbi:MAG: SCO family protein [Myxococcota bacterium]
MSAGTTDFSGPAPGRRGFLFRHPWIFFTVFGVAVLTLMRVACGSGRELGNLPLLGIVPEFSLSDQTGQAFGSKDLLGKPWVATFFFTSCQTQCPAIMAATARVQEALDAAGAAADGVKLVSFSVDPEFDTPEVLAGYAKEHGIDGKRWHLLTGKRADIEAVVVGKSEKNKDGALDQWGFATAMGEREPGQAPGKPAGIVDIAHSMKIVLVDAKGGIRYYFSATEPKDVGLVVTHAVQLAREAAKDAPKDAAR